MSLTLENLMGGGSYLPDANVSWTPDLGRVVRGAPTTSRNFTLPDATKHSNGQLIVLVVETGAAGSFSLLLDDGSAVGSSSVLNFSTATIHGTFSAGEVAVCRLVDNSTTNGVWIVEPRDLAVSSSIYTQHGAVGNIREDRGALTDTYCQLWSLTNCEDATDILYSREDWSAKEGDAVDFTFDAGTFYLVEKSATNRGVEDTRDLLSLINSTNSGGCFGPWELLASSDTTSGTDQVRFLSKADGTESGRELTLSNNSVALANFHNRRSEGDYAGFMISTLLEVLNTSTGSSVSVSAPSGEAFILTQNALNRYGSLAVTSSGHFYACTEETAIVSYRTCKLRRYDSSGSVDWTRSYVGASPTSYNRAVCSREQGGYIAVAINKTGGHIVEILDASTGSLVNSFPIGAATTTLQLNVEAGVPYVYFSHDSSFWTGGGGADYSIVKFNGLTGSFVWGYDALGGGGSSSLNAVVYGSHVYVNKGFPNPLHDGATTDAYLLRLDLSGNLVSEWVPTLASGASEYLDIDETSGDILMGDGNNTQGAVINGSDGSILWEGDAALKFAGDDGWGLDSEVFLIFTSGSK